MIIPYEIFKENKRFKESIDNAQNETDILLYNAAKEYSNSVRKRAKAVTDIIMERIGKEIKNS